MIYNGHISNSLVTPGWQAGNVYSTNDLVVYNSLIYRVKTTHTAATAPNADATNYEVANLNTSNLFVDSVNNRVGIGTSTPATTFNVKESGTGSPRGVLIEQINNGAQGVKIFFRKDRAGSAVSLSDSMMTFDNLAYDGTSYLTTARIITAVESAVSTGVIPTYMSFLTGNGTTFADRMRISSTGEVSIGTTNAISSVKLNVTHGFGQTDTTERIVSFFGSNEAASAGISPSGLAVSYKGGASIGVREVGIYNTLYGSASTGILNFNRGALIIDSSGNVGIGASSNDAKLTIQASAATGIQLTRSLKNSVGATRFTELYDADNIRLSIGNRSSSPILTLEEITGNIGIGVTPTTFKLEINDSSTAGLALIGSGDHCFQIKEGSASRFSIRNAAANTYINTQNQGLLFLGVSSANSNGTTIPHMFIDSSGSVSIGAPSIISPNKLTLHTVSDTRIKLTNDTTGTTVSQGAHIALGGNDLYVWNFQSAPMIFGTANTERMRLDSVGSLLLGSSSGIGTGVGQQEITFTNARHGMRLKNAGATANVIQFLNQSGVQVGIISHNDTNTSYGISSDYRLKKDVQPLENALNRVALLNPVAYKWISNNKESEGFIAHELAKVCPQAVVGEKDAVHDDGSIKPQSVDSSYLVALLTKAIQELSSKIDVLQNEINVLKAK